MSILFSRERSIQFEDCSANYERHSVKIIKSVMFYLRGTCPHSFKSISPLNNLNLYFGMSSVSLFFSRVVVGKKLSILSFSTDQYFYAAGAWCDS